MQTQCQSRAVRFQLLVPAMVTIVAIHSAAFSQDDRKDRGRVILRAMKGRVGMLRGERGIESKRELLRFAPNPILRFSDPARERLVGDGTLWRLGDSGRPSAILAVEFLAKKSLFSFELVSLSGDNVRVAGTTGWEWTPSSDFVMTKFGGAQRPDSLPEQRLRQMKKLARRFRTSQKVDGSTSELRLLPQPVYRYDDLDKAVIDGAVFVFAHGTNPEILVIIEALNEPSKWQYGLSRLTSAELRAQLDGSVVWRRPNVQPFDASAEYYATSESVTIAP